MMLADSMVQAEAPQNASWRALLDGEDRELALAAVDAIALDLRRRIAPTSAEDRALTGRIADASLGNGLPGIALFFHYLHASSPDHGWDELALTAVEQCLEAQPEAEGREDLYGGVVGSAWLLEHLRGSLLSDDSGADEVVRELHASVENWPQVGDYDLISGLVGIGVLATEAMRHPGPGREAAARLYDLVLRELVEQSSLIDAPEGRARTWWTPPQLLPEHQREVAPEGYYNLGVAHGMPGIAGLLGLAAAHRSQTFDGELIGEVVRGIQREPTCDRISRYGSWRVRGGEVASGRLAWCYGDPGVSVALLLAAAGSSDPGADAWAADAHQVARRAFSNPEGRRGVLDGGLCHGAAGLGHLCNRIHQHTDNPFFADQMRHWFRGLLTFRRPGEGVGGFSAFNPAITSKPTWSAEPGFLTGASGIGLALLAATTEVEPEWDRLLLASLPPRRFRGAPEGVPRGDWP